MISKSEKFKFTPRIIAYSFVLLALLTFLGYLLSSRTPLEASIVRTPGMLYQEQEQDQISNLYNLKVINKTRKDMPVEIRLLSHEGKVVVASGELLAKKQEKAESVVFLYLKKSDLTKEKVKVQFGIFSEGKLIQEINTWFLGPNIN